MQFDLLVCMSVPSPPFPRPPPIPSILSAAPGKFYARHTVNFPKPTTLLIHNAATAAKAARIRAHSKLLESFDMITSSSSSSSDSDSSSSDSDESTSSSSSDAPTTDEDESEKEKKDDRPSSQRKRRKVAPVKSFPTKPAAFGNPSNNSVAATAAAASRPTTSSSPSMASSLLPQAFFPSPSIDQCRTARTKLQSLLESFVTKETARLIEIELFSKVRRFSCVDWVGRIRLGMEIPIRRSLGA